MVSALAVIALVASQAPVSDVSPQPLRCALVTPGGDAVNFAIPAWSETEQDVSLVAGRDTVWPQRTLPGARGMMSDSPGAESVIAFGGASGLALEVAPAAINQRQRAATLYRRDRRRLALPVAFGSCASPPERVSMIYRAIDLNAPAGQIGADIPAFDPAHWPESDCGLILSDARRMRFSFRLDPAGSVRVSSPNLWSGRPVTLSMRWGRPRNGLQFGSFGRRGGPTGTQVMHVNQNQGNGVKLIQLSSLGDPSAADGSGYAICGYRGLVRGRARES